MSEPKAAVRDYGRELLGVVVIAFGVVFLLDATGTFSADRAIDDWWPVIVIAVGALQLAEGRAVARRAADRDRGGDGAVAVHDRRPRRRRFGITSGRSRSSSSALALLFRGGRSLPKGAGPDEEMLRASGIFSGPELASSSQSFRGASLTAVFGGVTLDLRGARPAPEGATVKATAAFGGVDVIVPKGWRITVRDAGAGGVDEQVDRSQPPAEDAPSLHVDAMALFGGVELKHEK